MQKYWILLASFFLAFFIIIIAPDTSIENFSGMAHKSLDYCLASCGEMSRFYFKQGSSPDNILSYTINEGDYFLVTLYNFTDNIVALYRFDGLKLDSPGALPNSAPYQDTGNYVKLSLIYAKIASNNVIYQDAIVYNFNCKGKQILVPIINPGYVGKEISLGKDSANRGYYFANVQIKPFEHIGHSSFYYSTVGKQLSDYALAAILIKGPNPVGFSRNYIGKSSLLVDIDGDGSLGGDVSDSYGGTGICSTNVYRGNLPGLRTTSYRGAGSPYP